MLCKVARSEILWLIASVRDAKVLLQEKSFYFIISMQRLAYIWYRISFFTFWSKEVKMKILMIISRDKQPVCFVLQRIFLLRYLLKMRIVWMVDGFWSVSGTINFAVEILHFVIARSDDTLTNTKRSNITFANKLVAFLSFFTWL